MTREEYEALHQACPKCGSDERTETMMCSLIELENGQLQEPAQDRNRYHCLKCGARGFVYERVPTN